MSNRNRSIGVALAKAASLAGAVRYLIIPGVALLLVLWLAARTLSPLSPTYLESSQMHDLAAGLEVEGWRSGCIETSSGFEYYQGSSAFAEWDMGRLLDRWGRPLLLERDGKRGLIRSLGADGLRLTEDDFVVRFGGKRVPVCE